MRKVFLIVAAVLAAAAGYAAPGSGSLERLLVEKNGILTGAEWKQMPADAKYSYVAGYLGAAFSISDWTETMASERSNEDIERVAVSILGLTKGPDVSVKWLSDRLDSFYANARNEGVEVFAASLAILKQDASR